MPTPTPHSTTIEDVPEPPERNVGGTTLQLMEPNPEYIPLPPLMSGKILDLTEVTPLY